MLKKLFFHLVFFTLITACGSPAPSPQPTPRFEVDVLFRGVYEYLGGVELLRQPISSAMVEGETTSQFFETCELIFDGKAPATDRFRMAPLGTLPGLREPPVPPPHTPGLLYTGGHVVSPDFQPLFEKLSQKFVGKPVTEVRYNPNRKRYEQFFENMGMYRLEGSNEVHLLAYGAWACGNLCQVQDVDQEAEMDIQLQFDPAFFKFASQYGVDFTGFPLTEGYQRKSGEWVEVLENVVLSAAQPESTDQIHLLPLPSALGIKPELPRAASGQPGMHFYPIQDGLGYEIPDYFWDYIQAHGGFEIAGPPITHLNSKTETTFRQCFVNLCLTLDSQALGGGRVRPEPLGYMYKLLLTSGTGGEQLAAPGSGETVIQVDRANTVRSMESQVMVAKVIKGGLPVQNAAVELILRLPDGQVKTYEMPRTDASGRSSYTLPPITAPNGTLIVYNVCAFETEAKSVCLKGSFIIWDFP